MVALGGAVVVTVGVGVLLFTGGDGGEEAASGQTGGQLTPLSQQRGAPTPQPGTGVLEPQRPEMGGPAPDFALVDARDGKTIRKLSDYRGTPVVLNWYASWCGPCKDEIPDFQKAHEALGDSVVFLGIDPYESSRAAVSILNSQKATYPAVLDSTGEVSEHYRVKPLPTTYFIDAEGIIRAVRVGRVIVSSLEEGLLQVGVKYKAKGD